MPENFKRNLSDAEEGESPEINIPEELPLLAVRDIVVFPNMILPLFVGRESSILAIEAALAQDRLIFLVTQHDPEIDDPQPTDIYDIGTVCLIMRMLKLPDGRLKILVQGLSKSKIVNFQQERPFLKVIHEVMSEIPAEELSIEAEALMRNAREMTEKILSLKGILSPEMSSILESIEEPGRLANLIASNLHLKIEEAQEILEQQEPIHRLIRINDYLRRELEVSTMQAKIQSEAKEEIDRSQREYFLREQLRAIKKELGDFDDRPDEIEEYQQKIAKARMPKAVEEEAVMQLTRLEQMHPDAAEATMVRTYLDWLVEVPWSKNTRDKLELEEAKDPFWTRTITTWRKSKTGYWNTSVSVSSIKK